MPEAPVDITGAIVLYDNDPAIVGQTIASFLATDLSVRLYLVDNSASDRLRALASDPRTTYLFAGRNVGFGAGHNIAMRHAREDGAPFHAVLNPDLRFARGTLEALASFAGQDERIGIVMPRITDPDGVPQHLCRTHPRPFDLLARRFLPRAAKRYVRGRLDRFELRHKDHDSIMDVPVLSGCFMFCRTGALEGVGGFDERFFLYLEDYDLCRRVGASHRLVYFPHASAVHLHGRHSYRRLKPLALHVRSAIAYFNKWGWRPLM